ncbi:MAG TPA: response regulator FixJ [Rhizomicrobium sp.]|jgi:two-component system response regulator FixJ|nr:response regulator FixJ [Rhizomicrobium sp.]
MNARSEVLVVDDDAAVRDSIRVLLEDAGYAVKDYDSATAFLADPPSSDSCMIVDIRMPEIDGLELQEEIVRRGLHLPVIVMTGHGDVPLAVRAMKAGAIDFIEKPFDAEILLKAVARALHAGESQRSKSAEIKAAQDLIALLTPRERHVLDQLVAGRSNKIAAFELGISPRTIEIHRAHIMDKMHARSLSDLVRIAIAAGPSPKT